MTDRNWTHRGNLKLVKHTYLAGNQSAPYDVLEYCRAEKKPIPAWAVDAVLADHKREANTNGKYEARMRQRWSDSLCLGIVRLLRKEHSWKVSLDMAAKMLRKSTVEVKHGYVRAAKIEKTSVTLLK